MNVFGIGTGELLLILLIVLLVMGPERLPQLARQWGKFVRVLSRFTRTWQEISAEINRQINLEEMARPSPKSKPAPTPPTPEPEESYNTIAPPELLQSAVPRPDDAVQSPTPPPDIAVEAIPAGDDPITSPARPTNPVEPTHE